MQALIRGLVLWCLVFVCTVCHCSKCPNRQPSIKAPKRHSDKNSATINCRYLDFVQASDLISFVNNNHIDYDLKEILAFVYCGSIVNNRHNDIGIRCVNFERSRILVCLAAFPLLTALSLFCTVCICTY